MIIAIDGPAASGKGTLARRLAEHFGYAHLDTGALYRAVGRLVLAAGKDPADEQAAIVASRSLTADMLDDPLLRSEAAGDAASKVAAVSAVRANLLEFQRDFASHPPEGRPGAVIDGRDIGTVVCPDADVKIFVTASIEERARRRYAEMQQREEQVDFGRVLADLIERDRRDTDRTVSPLKPASDAHLLDTTNLDIDAAFAQALGFVKAAGAHADQ